MSSLRPWYEGLHDGISISATLKSTRGYALKFLKTECSIIHCRANYEDSWATLIRSARTFLSLPVAKASPVRHGISEALTSDQ